MSVLLEPQGLTIVNETIEELETVGTELDAWQRRINWAIGDLAAYAAARWPDRWQQVFPETMSMGLILRCKGVSESYPMKEQRNYPATWAQHRQVANDPDRVQKVAAMVAKGQTTDESREEAREQKQEPERWLLAIDVHYYVHRHFHSGAGVEAGSRVASWIGRTVERLREKGLTDAVCCFDSETNHRKELTKDWPDKYKDRPPKERELVDQLRVVRELLEADGFCSVSIDGMEADDCMASYARSFPGKVTLLTQDKDVRQCLCKSANILLDVNWVEDETSGELLPQYKWLSAKQHTQETGVPPGYWTDFQALMGDNCDGIKGAEGIGEKGAKDLLEDFGTAQEAVRAALDGDETIPAKKRAALINFALKLETTMKLVTLRFDLDVPMTTRLA